MTLRRSTLLPLVAVIAAGCGGGSGGGDYAGLDEKTARLNAYDAFQDMLTEPASPYPALRMQLVGVRKDAAPDGHKAWLALFRSSVDDDERICIWVAATMNQPGADSRPCAVRFAGEAEAPPA